MPAKRETVLAAVTAPPTVAEPMRNAKTRRERGHAG